MIRSGKTNVRAVTLSSTKGREIMIRHNSSILAFAWVVSVICSSALGSTVITLQQDLNGYTGTTDAWLNEGSKTRNYGVDPVLHIQWNNGRSDATVLKFDLTGQIPPNQRILSATLYLWYGSAESMGPTNAIELKPYRVDPTKPWFENIYNGEAGHGVNWRWRDDAEAQEWTGQDGAWSDKIDDGNGTIWIQDSDGEVGGNPPPTKPGNWIGFTTTTSVRAWYEQGAANNGFSLFSINFVGNGYIAAGLFSSRNHGTQWSRPELVITYEGALPPIAEAGGPYSVGPGGSVVFDGSGSYDPDGGPITAWQWDLDNDGLYDDATGIQVSKTYAELRALGLAPGEHTIALRVVDDENESGTDTARLTILPELDFGDAPDPSYPTLLANNGARHAIMPGVYLGACIDGELDAWQDPAALGDDNHGIDDEDGVSFSTLRRGQPASIQVTASTGGYVSAWLDFDANGSWAESNDRIVNNVSVPGGTTTLNFTVPSAAVVGTTFARVRFSTTGGLSYVGQAADGEVEDYQVTILNIAENDLGDAPDSTNSYGVAMTAYPVSGIAANFPTVYRLGSPPFGPIHLRPRAAAFLGDSVTVENEADSGLDEDPQNNILPLSNTPNLDGGDDGVPVPLTLPHCQEVTFDYTVTVTGTTAVPLYVNVWFDWNRDGDWDDVEMCDLNVYAPEWAVQNQVIAPPGPGQYIITTPPFLPWHPTNPPEWIWMRITLSEKQWQPTPQPGYGGSGPALGYQFGETEDYFFVPRVPQANEACCFDTGECHDMPSIECELQGGTPQGSGTQCTNTMQACCLSTGVCMMADPICCDDLGGTAQGEGTSCATQTIACCLDDGTCRDVDPICCDDIGGHPGYAPNCLGDQNHNGVDDACEPPLEPKWVQPPQQGGQGFDAVSNLWWPEPPHIPEVNKVMADDFISDGRVVKALNWWGSYWDTLFEPTHPPIEPYVVDGWLIGFHHAEPVRPCPPDPAAADLPTALGVYFAPAGAVQINPLFMADCFGHTVFQYQVDFSQCCLLCSESDPRLPMSLPPPALSDGFHEVSGMRYWLSIQAVVGVEWLPSTTMECEKRLTGHLPSPNTPDGHFWGWHTSAADFMPQGPLAEACTGRIVDFTPPAPNCWDYGDWYKQPWLCNTMPPFPRVDEAFVLLAPPCEPRGDMNQNGAPDIDDVPCFVECLVMAYSIGCTCGCADMNRDYLVNGLDIQLFVDALLAP
jgi:hypothetical protein